MNNKVENLEYKYSGNTMNDHSMPTVITQPQIPMAQTPNATFGPHPQVAICPSCHQTQTTRINYDPNMKTHLIAALLCITTCLGCIPYMVESCKSANHYCSNCGVYLNTYNK